MKTGRYDVKWIGGVDRASEASDKPPFFPTVLKDVQTLQDGVWSLRDKPSQVYPDRGDYYERTNPIHNRNIASSIGEVIGSSDSVWYNSHKRKTVLYGSNNGQDYIFAGVCCSYNKDGGHQLRLYRGTIGDDIITWDPDYKVLVQLTDFYLPFGETQVFIEYSMVMSENKDYIYFVFTIRDDTEVVHSHIETAYIRDIYNAVTSNMVVDALCTDLKDVLESLSGTTKATNGLDIEIQEDVDGDKYLCVIYGLRNTTLSEEKQYYLKMRSSYFINDESVANWDNEPIRTITSETANLLSPILRAYNDLGTGSLRGNIGIAYTEMTTETVGDRDQFIATIIHRYVGSGIVPSERLVVKDDIRIESVAESALIEDIDEWQYLGAFYLVSTGNIDVFAWRQNSYDTVYVKVGKTSNSDIPICTMHRANTTYLFKSYLYTCVDIVVADNYLIAYYKANTEGYSPTSSQQGAVALDGSNLGSQIMRQVYVFSQDDTDYVSTLPLERELVEDKRRQGGLVTAVEPHQHTFLCAYQGYDTDRYDKFVSYIRFNKDDTRTASSFNCVWQDTQGLEQKSVIRTYIGHFSNTRITVIQCDDNRYYWRRTRGQGDWKWNLCKGQMTVGNEDPLYTTEVDDRTNFWMLNNVLRGGNGTEIPNKPMVYQHLKRKFYWNTNTIRNVIDDNFITSNEIKPPKPDTLITSIGYTSDPDIFPLGDYAVGELRNEASGAVVVLTAKRVGAYGNTIRYRMSVVEDEAEFMVDLLTVYTVRSDGYTDKRWDIGLTGWRWTTLNQLIQLINGANDLPITATLVQGIDGTAEANIPKEPVAYTQMTGGEDSEFADTIDFISYSGSSLKPRVEVKKVGNEYELVALYPPARVSHPFKKIEITNSEVTTVSVNQPYIDVFFGFAFRYDFGQISQITPQQLDDPYKLGYVAIPQDRMANMGELKGDAYRFAQIRLELKKYYAMTNPSDKRITSLLIFMKVVQFPGETKTDSPNGYRLVKEVPIAKATTDLFKDDLIDGDLEWDTHNPPNDDWVEKTHYVTYQDYIKRYLVSEGAIDIIGHGLPIDEGKADQNPYIQGYKYAEAIHGRPFYLNLRVNNRVLPSAMMWAGYGLTGNASYVTPDVTGLENIKLFSFNGVGIRGLKDHLIIFGDTDIDYGIARGAETNWEFRGTLQDIGVIAPRSISLLAASVETGIADGMMFLNASTGLHLFNIYQSPAITDRIFETYKGGDSVNGSQVLTDYKGVKDLVNSNAMAIHFEAGRKLLLHFPTEGITFVRDYGAEARARNSSRGGGSIWYQWQLLPNPKAWCENENGQVLYTDGTQLYIMFENDEYKHSSAVSPLIRIGDYLSPIAWNTNDLVPLRAHIEYLLTELDGDDSEPTLGLKFIKDNGNRPSVSLSFPLKTKITRVLKEFGIAKGRAENRLALEITLANTSNVDKFELHSITADIDVV